MVTGRNYSMSERKVLITLLGRSEKGVVDYRTTRYRFPDGSISEPVAFLGWELLKRTHPDKIIVLGTAGSMWDNLILPAGSSDQDRYGTLIDSVAAKHVTDDQIQFFAPKLSEVMEVQVDLQIISESRTEEEQLALLARVDPLIEDGDVLTLDITHGFRHLPVLLLLAIVYLRAVRSITVGGVYSSFYDSDVQQGFVFDMSGLLKLLDWYSALNAFGKDGDPGVFKSLLKEDGLGEDALRSLTEASYQSRIHRHVQAWTAERTVANQLSKAKLRGVSNLFAPYLKSRLGSKVERDPAIRLARMAWKHLDLGSYDRAAFFGLSAAQAHLANAGEDLDDLEKEIWNGKRGTPEFLEAFDRLNGIRNSIAHTDSTATKKLRMRAISGKEEELREELKGIFKKLFSS